MTCDESLHISNIGEIFVRVLGCPCILGDFFKLRNVLTHDITFGFHPELQHSILAGLLDAGHCDRARRVQGAVSVLGRQAYRMLLEFLWCCRDVKDALAILILAEVGDGVAGSQHRHHTRPIPVTLRRFSHHELLVERRIRAGLVDVLVDAAEEAAPLGVLGQLLGLVSAAVL